MKKYIISISVITIIILILFGSYYIYSNSNSQNSIDALKSKVDEEIIYLNTTIVSMLNQLNNITYANYEIVEEEVSSGQSNTENGSSSGGQQSQGQESSGESRWRSKSEQYYY